MVEFFYFINILLFNQWWSNNFLPQNLLHFHQPLKNFHKMPFFGTEKYVYSDFTSVIPNTVICKEIPSYYLHKLITIQSIHAITTILWWTVKIFPIKTSLDKHFTWLTDKKNVFVQIFFNFCFIFLVSLFYILCWTLECLKCLLCMVGTLVALITNTERSEVVFVLLKYYFLACIFVIKTITDASLYLKQHSFIDN